MTKLLKKLRSILRRSMTKAKIKISVAVNILFFKIEASYERDMTQPPDQA